TASPGVRPVRGSRGNPPKPPGDAPPAPIGPPPGFGIGPDDRGANRALAFSPRRRVDARRHFRTELPERTDRTSPMTNPSGIPTFEFAQFVEPVQQQDSHGGNGGAGGSSAAQSNPMIAAMGNGGAGASATNTSTGAAGTGTGGAGAGTGAAG